MSIMRVKIGKKAYVVDFSTEAIKPKYGKRNGDDDLSLVRTHCLIANGSTKPRVKRLVMGQGFATQSYHDKLEWHVGRKIALARALAKTRINKVNRAEFWNTYKEKYSIKGK